MTVPLYNNRQAMAQEPFTNHQMDIIIKVEFARYSRQSCPTSDKCHSGTAHHRELLAEGVHEQFVIFGRS